MDINDSDHDELREAGVIGDATLRWCNDCQEEHPADEEDPDMCPRCKANGFTCGRCDEWTWGVPDYHKGADELICSRCNDGLTEDRGYHGDAGRSMRFTRE